MAEIRSGDRVLTTEQLHDRAARAASGLAKLGVQSGDVLAMVLRNDFAFFEASSAAGVLGAYPTPVNWHATPVEAEYLLRDSGAKAIVIHADLLAALKAAIPEHVTVLAVPTPPEVAAAYAIDPASCEIPEGVQSWNDFIEANTPWDGAEAEPPGTIIYTSGTTGHPKGVRRAAPNAAQARANRDLIRKGMGFLLHEDDPENIITVITGPMYHSAPNGHGAMAARIGATVILQPRFDPEGLLQLIGKHRVTHLHMVPVMFNRLIRLPDAVKAKYDTSSLEFVIHAAAPVSPPIKRAMIEWWGPVIHEYYGSTETSMLTGCTSEEWLAHPGTVGKPVEGAVIKILGPDGAELPAGEVGEVAARNMKLADFTYQGDDAKRRDASAGDLIKPGDIGFLDEDGFLFLCDRAKDLIISGGVNIYPAEVEAELQKAPGVADCAVFGIPDDEFGEAVHAAIQLMTNEIPDADAIRRYLRGRIASYKIPRSIDFVTDLPREDSGKIFKRKLREPYWRTSGRKI